MIGITLHIIWGTSEVDCRENFKMELGNFKRWKLFPTCWTRNTVQGRVYIMVAYAFNLPE